LIFLWGVGGLGRLENSGGRYKMKWWRNLRVCSGIGGVCIEWVLGIGMKEFVFQWRWGLKRRETPGVRGLQHHRVVMTLVSLGTL
jgi:hypothetical protein